MDTAMPADKRQQTTLSGTRVLLIEDEYYIADDLRRALLNAKAQVVGPVLTVTAARDAISSGGFDCAVLDLNLHGESAIPVLEELANRQIGTVIATGYGSPAVPEHLDHIPRIEKPFDPARLVEVLSRLDCARASVR